MKLWDKKLYKSFVSLDILVYLQCKCRDVLFAHLFQYTDVFAQRRPLPVERSQGSVSLPFFVAITKNIKD